MKKTFLLKTSSVCGLISLISLIIYIFCGALYSLKEPIGVIILVVISGLFGISSVLTVFLAIRQLKELVIKKETRVLLNYKDINSLVKSAADQLKKDGYQLISTERQEGSITYLFGKDRIIEVNIFLLTVVDSTGKTEIGFEQFDSTVNKYIKPHMMETVSVVSTIITDKLSDEIISEAKRRTFQCIGGGGFIVSLLDVENKMIIYYATKDGPGVMRSKKQEKKMLQYLGINYRSI